MMKVKYKMLAIISAMFVILPAAMVHAAPALISVEPNGAGIYNVVLTRETAPATMLNIALSCTPSDDPIITMPGGWGVVGGVNFVKRSDAVILVMGNSELSGLKVPAGVLAKVHATNIPVVSYSYKGAPTSMQFAASGSSIVEYALGITALPEEEIKIASGATHQLEAAVLPAIATNNNVVWSSSNTSVATVATDGLVTARGNGSTVITAATEDGGFSTSCTVTVMPDVIPVAGIALNKTVIELMVGQSMELIATILPDNASNKGVTWASGNPDAARVKDGLVEALSAGETEITAMTNDGEYAAKCKVVVTTTAEPDGGNGGGGCNAGMTWPLLIAIATALLYKKWD